MNSPGRFYPCYALIVLMLVYFFSIIDRQILAILAEDIKSDLDISDAQMGFLFGTVFALFYSIFGIPLGKLSDVATRKNVVAAGLSFWSLMTALSGMAQSFLQLAALRIGVGVGESSTSPAVYSLLSDYFSPKVRATVISIYSGGIYIGAGMGLLIGGAVVEWWNQLYPDKASAPFQMAGWQAAFVIVGLPGILLALLVYTLKEPVRGSGDGLEVSSNKKRGSSAGAFLEELASIIPPFNFVLLVRRGASGAVLTANILFGLVLTAMTSLVIYLLGFEHLAQWLAVGIGCYGVFSWIQSLKLRDPVAHGVIFGCKSLQFSTFGIGTISIVSTAGSLWLPVFFIRSFGLAADEAGRVLGLMMMFGGWLGVTLGGVLSDRLKRRYDNGRVVVGLMTALLLIPTTLLILSVSSLGLAYISFFLTMITVAMYIPTGPAIITDLVLPRIRAIASAFYIFVLGILGFALGPYLVGLASDLLEPTLGVDALRYCLMGSLVVLLPGIALLLKAMKYIGQEESNRLERARQLGEVI